MTAKRDSKRKPKKDERPKVKKEKLKDLVAKDRDVKGGAGAIKAMPSCSPPCSL